MGMLNRYIEVDGKPVICKDYGAWNEMMADSDRRRVGSTQLKCGDWVSTVFLGLDHAFGENKPLLYETMWFGQPDPDEEFHLGKEKGMMRYSTREEALAGHWAMVWEAQKANGEAQGGH